MPDPIRRVETTHIDEVSRKATSTLQWFAEKRHATHPITHNNRLTILHCGEEGFERIATDIQNAKESIDLICWGFDPGMELKRGGRATWPRGPTYGDLLIAAAKRGVRVRLLVWFDRLVANVCRNMPGHSHGKRTWRSGIIDSTEAELISASRSLNMLQSNWQKPHLYGKGEFGSITPDMIPLRAREEYCYAWYRAAFRGFFKGIEVRKRSCNSKNIEDSLKSETTQPGSMGTIQIERAGFVYVGTHHQKTILIDFAHEGGRKSLGYVMGLNSVTDYWDTCAHKLEDCRREQGDDLSKRECIQGRETDAGFSSLKPYQDYACRIEGGKALISVYNNFATAWDRSTNDVLGGAVHEYVKGTGCKAAPPALLRAAVPGDSTVQIIRTQPDEADKTVKEVYALATDVATLAGGYLYVENQYFQNEEWALRLMQKRKDVVSAWKRGAAQARRTLEDLPIMHVFIVIPVPEREQMIPRTHDTLSAFGQGKSMTGQSAYVVKETREKRTIFSSDELGIKTGAASEIPIVVHHANEIEFRNEKILESEFGMRVCAAMLQTSGVDKGRMRYREIYIHSKLLLIDDGFVTLGSANLNQRSMAVDSEINLATNDLTLARGLRERIWSQHSGGAVTGKSGTREDIEEAFREWTKLMRANRNAKNESVRLQGFLLPLEDKRKSKIRLG